MRQRILIYSFFFLATLGLISALLFLAKEQRRWAPDPAGDLPGKTAYYLLHAQEFDLVLLGDSRTYCALHPEFLDPLLGTHSLNLAHWAHWLPTQLPQFQDLAAHIPAGTTVVWSISEGNFFRSIIYDKYPIGLRNVQRYRDLGIPLETLVPNLGSFNPLLFLYEKRGTLNERIQLALQRPLRAGASASVAASAQGTGTATDVLAPVRGHYAGLTPQPAYELVSSKDRPVAVALHMPKGGYLLEELDHEHFRTLREQFRRAGRPEIAGEEDRAIDPARWSLFLIALDTLRQAGCHVVVNIMEEAPLRYYSPQEHASWRAFMDGPVRREVLARGFGFLHLDLSTLANEHYFDNAHLNVAGVQLYTAFFAEALRPYLPQVRRP